EKGFGTGLRAQLERRRGEDDRVPEQPASTNVELRLELTARPASDSDSLIVGEEVGALKAELDAAQRREAALRSRLEQQSVAYGDDMSSEKELAARAATLDAREAKLAEFEVDLEERERRLSARESDLKKDSARVSAKDEVLGERESELLLKQERMRTEAERFERELSDKGRLAQEAVARAADLDRRELDLTAREAELNRL